MLQTQSATPGHALCSKSRLTSCSIQVLTFDEFLTIPPCTIGKHSATAPTLAPAQTSGPGSQKQKHPEVAPPPETNSDGTEVYGLQNKSALQAVAPAAPPSEKKEQPLEQDDPNATVPGGAKCKRLGCDVSYFGGDEKGVCVFHPGVPIFHEGESTTVVNDYLRWGYKTNEALTGRKCGRENRIKGLFVLQAPRPGI